MLKYIYTSLHKGVTVHRLNLTIDEELYEQARAFSFIEKKSISQIIRESLNEYLSKNSKIKQQADLILEAEDEKEILSILANEEFSSNDDFKSKFNL
jgi:post-segregation antitoxin (ccd killing protein)